MITISVDMMGGDNGLSITVPACLSFLKKNKDVKILFVGDSDSLQKKLPSSLHQNIVHAEEVLLMDDTIETAMRKKRKSSMRIAIKHLKDGLSSACVSSGNTGALMALSRFNLKTLEGVDRPAIASVMPNKEGGAVTVLDLGANVDCNSEHLLDFAILANAFVKTSFNIKEPKVALLNIGHEENKGNQLVKESHQKFKDNKSFNYVGFTEGDDIFSGNNDIVVCDGFVGNVALKSIEGVSKMISNFLKQEFKKNIFTKIAALFSLTVMKNLRNKVDPRIYNGAPLLGLNGLVIKSHGSADVFAFEKALARAVKMVKADMIKMTIESIQNEKSNNASYHEQNENR